jgi:hypothetical protein
MTPDMMAAYRETAARYARTLKALADTPDPAAWVGPAAERAEREVAEDAIRAEERAAIVAWLRREDAAYTHGNYYRHAALRIERGEHRETR